MRPGQKTSNRNVTLSHCQNVERILMSTLFSEGTSVSTQWIALLISTIRYQEEILGWLIFILFYIWILFHELLRITGLHGKVEVISLTPLYHFHPFASEGAHCRGLTSSHSSCLDSNCESLISKRKLLNTKLQP